ncbi:tripartite tricarboxylate transporter substrate binding protein [Ramlibacter sp. WS9]|uniref:Bug family tripartite tricarboxylate transporter substrate binding protein n=1 Tax=Ramlibacter sp. WS9 TaxID=1882741 RepID=UPI001141C066|nr:tripartite tricarboxylate transporter substrate binding protein [Ramlibacter sp. WS9]ROZ78051.1 tripartite tricarboxylate transporter substrate binding protein [Ramlibacter sp. WS9]
MTSVVWKTLGLLFALTLAPLPALAQAYPAKPIKLVVTWPPGGSADAIGRLVAGALAVELGQSVFVENAAGASGNIGTQQFVRSQPDGYTLLLATSTTNAASPALFTKIGFHPITDFVPVAPIALSPSILIVPAASPYKSPKDIVAAAKANPGKLAYGSGGNGNSGHLSAELFKSVAKVDAQHVPYKGNAPAMVDLIGGQIDFMFDNGAVAMIQGGKVRGLAVASERRLAAVPDIPTFAELGWPGVQLSTWFGMAAPKGTPAAVVERLNNAMTAALQKPEIAKRLQDMGAEPKTSTPAAFASFWTSELDRYRDLVKLSGAKIE